MLLLHHWGVPCLRVEPALLVREATREEGQVFAEVVHEKAGLAQQAGVVEINQPT